MRSTLSFLSGASRGSRNETMAAVLFAPESLILFFELFEFGEKWSGDELVDSEDVF